ncbi:MAG: rRNA ((1408)-N(1))-methyltransferase [Actinomycetota bacterium]|jgi:16S rRNA (adenine(1408)-N(1))-methyltransferase|nr:rRNA ((1408)-N(1))-methyltransferase [Actinomycetota bacterium]
MTLTRVVGKGRTEVMDPGELDALRNAFAKCAVDVGTGDARFAYHLASERPDWLVIGLDALDAPMGEIAYRASRKPARGGRENLLLLRAAIEALPPELAQIADEVDVLLPWGALLEGIVRARAEIVQGIARLARPGAVVNLTLNGEIWLDSTPARYEDLPLPTPAYVAESIEPEFLRAGIELRSARYLTAAEAKGLPTTWARRLGHGRAHPQFVHMNGVRRDP